MQDYRQPDYNKLMQQKGVDRVSGKARGVFRWRGGGGGGGEILQ